MHWGIILYQGRQWSGRKSQKVSFYYLCTGIPGVTLNLHLLWQLFPYDIMYIYIYIYTHIKYIIVYGQWHDCHYLPAIHPKSWPILPGSQADPQWVPGGRLTADVGGTNKRSSWSHGCFLFKSRSSFRETSWSLHCELYFWLKWELFNQPRKAFLCCLQCQGVDGGGPGLRSGILILFAFSLSEQLFEMVERPKKNLFSTVER